MTTSFTFERSDVVRIEDGMSSSHDIQTLLRRGVVGPGQLLVAKTYGAKFDVLFDDGEHLWNFYWWEAFEHPYLDRYEILGDNPPDINTYDAASVPHPRSWADVPESLHWPLVFLVDEGFIENPFPA